MYLGPTTAKTVLANDNSVSATIDTLYPFSDSLTGTIQADEAFTYLVRIPSWVSDATVSLNGGSQSNIRADTGTGLASIPLPAGKSTFTLNLPAPITIGMFRSLW